jgi:hypothetical protein
MRDRGGEKKSKFRGQPRVASAKTSREQCSSREASRGEVPTTRSTTGPARASASPNSPKI